MDTEDRNPIMLVSALGFLCVRLCTEPLWLALFLNLINRRSMCFAWLYKIKGLMLRDVSEFTSGHKIWASTPLNITANCSSNISYPYTPPSPKRDTSQGKNRHVHHRSWHVPQSKHVLSARRALAAWERLPRKKGHLTQGFEG